MKDWNEGVRTAWISVAQRMKSGCAPPQALTGMDQRTSCPTCRSYVAIRLRRRASFLEMIDSAVADWMQSVAENKSAPVEYVFVSTLASAAAMIGRKRRCSPWLGWEEPSIFWGAFIGPPSI